MISGYILGLFILLAASSLGLMEKALGPDAGRFPCVGKDLIWSARLLTMILASRAFFVLTRSYNGTQPEVTPDQMLSAFAMAAFFMFLLLTIIRQRLPIGVWRRLQARHARVRQAAGLGGPVGATLAKAAADGDPVIIAPIAVLPTDAAPAEMLPVLERLAKMP